MPIASELVLRLRAHLGPFMIGFCLGLQGLVHNVQITLSSHVQVSGKQFPRQFLLSPPLLPGASLRAVMCKYRFRDEHYTVTYSSVEDLC